MEYRNVGASGLKVSEIAVGSWMTDLAGSEKARIAEETIRLAYDQGVNFFDCADAYSGGEAEKFLGRVLKDYRRSSYVVSSKVFFPTGPGVNEWGLSRKHIFENADVDWLHCIAAHRKKKMFIEVEREMAKYDIIAGKIADDATNATLTAYLAGAFGTAGDKEADDFCIRQLLPNKLKDQYCFKTEAAIECLKFVKGEKIWLK